MPVTFTGPDAAIKQRIYDVLLLNELGGDTEDAYQLSLAPKGRSGYSFGLPQYDLGSRNPTATDLFRDILLNARYLDGAYVIDDLDPATSRENDTEIERIRTNARDAKVNNSIKLDPFDLQLVNDALSSTYGRQAHDNGLDAYFGSIISHVRIVIGLVADPTSRGFLEQPLAFTFLADYHNQFNLDLSGRDAKLVRFLQGGSETIGLPNSVTLQVLGQLGTDDLLRFYLQTKQGQATPNLLLGRFANVVQVSGDLVVSGVEEAMGLMRVYEQFVHPNVLSSDSNRQQFISAVINPSRSFLIQEYVTTPGVGVAIDGQVVVGLLDNSGQDRDDAIGLTITTGLTTSERNDLVLAQGGNDTVEGGGGRDVIYGGDGNDRLLGGADDDTLNGGLEGRSDDSPDYLDGGAGNDTYHAYNHDVISDSDGQGRIIFNDQTIVDLQFLLQQTANGGIYRSADGSERASRVDLDGDGQSDDLRIHGSDLTILNFESGQFGITLDGLATEAPTPIYSYTLTGDLQPQDFDPNTLGIQAQDDQHGNFIRGEVADPGREDIVYGSSGNDLLNGVAGDDGLNGFAGSDKLIGGLGSDVLFGGNGSDRLHAEAETSLADAIAAGEVGIGTGLRGDLLEGGADDDLLIGSTGNDLQEGGLGKDQIVGGLGDDTIYGDRSANSADASWQVQRTVINSNGVDYQSVTVLDVYYSAYAITDGADDVITGGAGNDWIFAEGGNDIVDVGADDDVVFGSAGQDFVLGGSGNDNLSGDAIDDGTNNGLAGSLHGEDYLDGGAGDDILYGNGGSDVLIGGTNNDHLSGDDITTPIPFHGNDLLEGGSGNDVLIGHGGSDQLYGEADDDELYGDHAQVTTGAAANGDDYLDGGSGNDLLVGDGGDDVLDGGEDNDRLFGDFGRALAAGEIGGDDILDGGDGNDELAGEAGNDQLDGGSGVDRLFGDASYLTGDQHGNDELRGGAGNDLLVGGGGDVDLLDGGDDDDTLLGDDDALGAEFHGIDFIDGGKGNDKLIGHGGDDILYGGEGNDQIDGDSGLLAGQFHGDDELDGEAGDDVLIGNGGADTLIGGAGNDQLSGDAAGLAGEFQGIDNLDGGEGDDILVGGGGGDTLIGGSGNDQLSGDGTDLAVQFHGDDRIDGGAGNDLIFGEGGNDVLTGGAGLDQISGGIGNDTISGDDGNDTLVGNEGADTINGGTGADTLLGGAGDDLLTGGLGADRYLYNLGDGLDRIYDQIEAGIQNVLQFGAGIALADLTLSSSSGSLAIQVGTGGDVVHIEGFGPDSAHSELSIQRFVFSDGQSYTTSQLFEALAFGSVGGTAGDDVLDGTAGADTIRGGAGNDQISGLAGNDVLEGEAGNDILDGGDGDNQLLGGAGNDTLTAGLGMDRLDGGDGDDVLEGGGSSLIISQQGSMIFRGGDDLYGGAGNDVLRAGFGDNTLEGGTGDDELFGSNGSDTYIYNLGDGNDRISDQNNGSRPNVLRFGTGISIDGLSLSYGSLAIQVGANAGNVIHIEGYERGSDPQDLAIQRFEFANGLAYSASEFIDAVGFGSVGTDEDDVLIGTEQDDVIQGDAGNDQIQGRGGNDTLDGGIGIDTLDGGLGDDLYLVDDPDDVVVEAEQGGLDTIEVHDGIAYTIRSEVEVLRLIADDGTGIGDGRDNLLQARGEHNRLNGMDGDDLLEGSAHGDILDGGFGKDTMTGAGGDDTYHVDDLADVIVELEGQGTDTTVTAISHQLAANVENLIAVENAAIDELRGNGLDNLIIGSEGDNLLEGDAGNDRLQGLGGNDVLQGGEGSDTLEGGIGDDTYLVSDQGDSTIERLFEGIDTVRTSINWVLSGHIENLVLLNGNGASGTGNELNNEISGGAGNDTLIGLAGDDILDGGAGADLLQGGDGNDQYVVDDPGDVILEDGVSDLDRVKSTVTFVLSQTLESLTLLGGEAINGTGNVLDNVLVGNSASNTLTGGAGNDLLNGFGGGDQLLGGTGNDLYEIHSSGDAVVENVNEGIDVVSSFIDFTLTENVEDLALLGEYAGPSGGSFLPVYATGNSVNNQLTGNVGQNVLSGLAGDDRVDGLAGDDEIYGGTGNDTLYGGQDFIFTSGSSGYGGYGGGGSSMLLPNADQIHGEEGDDTIDGGSGNDQLFGGEGDDTLYGGDDGLYVFGDSSSYGGYGGYGGGAGALTNDDVLFGGIGNDALDGGSGDDTLYGNEGSDYLFGGNAGGYNTSNNDYLDGGLGLDVLAGGVGDDVFIVAGSAETVTLAEYASNDCAVASPGGDFEIAAEADEVIELEGEGYDIVESSVGIRLAAHVEELKLTGDAAINGIGNDLDNRLVAQTGNAANQLDGGAGADYMEAGQGNDVYYVDSEGDVIVELDGEGVDTVKTTLSTILAGNLENLFLLGDANLSATGNDADNIVVGNIGNNLVSGGAGNDILAGNGGQDSLSGGDGDDVFVYSICSDVEIIQDSSGNDEIQFGEWINPESVRVSTVTLGDGSLIARIRFVDDCGVERDGKGIDFKLAADGASPIELFRFSNGQTYTLTTLRNHSNAEEGMVAGLQLVGTLGSDQLTGGDGNDSLSGDEANDSLLGGAGRDMLRGGAGNDLLDGGRGADQLFGGSGNDSYVVDDDHDLVFEQGYDYDVVASSIDYVLPQNLEALTLLGTAGLHGIGNEGDNQIVGNDGNNLLSGGGGVDYLEGRGGNDVLNGGSGDDLLNDWLGSNLFFGGSGNDEIYSSGHNDLFIGGTGNDLIHHNGAIDTVVFNRGDGSDTVVDLSAERSLVLVLGGGIRYNDLSFVRQGSDFVFSMGTGDQITLKDWFAGVRPQVIFEVAVVANSDYAAASENPLLNQALVRFDFAGLMTRFEQAMAQNPNATSLQLASLLPEYYLDGSSCVIAGGQQAYDYAVLGTPGALGSAVTAQTLATLEAGIVYQSFVAAPGGAGSVIQGTAIDDYLLGTSGADSLSGLEGDDVLLGGGGFDTLDGGEGADYLAGGCGNDTYFVDNAGDVVLEQDCNWYDTIYSSISFVLPAYTEELHLTGTGNISGIGNDLFNGIKGNSGDNLLSGGAEGDYLEGGDGSDVLLGGIGNDLLNDYLGFNIFDGGQGNDDIYTSNKVDIIFGGAGNDLIHGNYGANVFGFNLGDGEDTIFGDSGDADDVLSLGGVVYEALSLTRQGSDLILNIGASGKITMADWYGGVRSIATLQVVASTLPGFLAGGSNALLDQNIETFNFTGLVNRFNQAVTANPGVMSRWDVVDALTEFHVGGSDTEAAGGDVANYFASRGSLDGLSLAAAHDVLAGLRANNRAPNLRPLGELTGGPITLHS